MMLISRLVVSTPVKLKGLQPALNYLPNVFKSCSFSTQLPLKNAYSVARCNFPNNQLRAKYVPAVNYNLVGKNICFSSLPFEKDSENLGTIVYQGRLKSMLRNVKIFSLSTSVLGICLQPFLLLSYQDAPLKLAIPALAVINFFVLINPLLIHYIAHKYILELYFNPDTKVFTAVILTFFARKKRFSFTAKDVQCPDVPNMFAMFTAKGKPFFVNEDDFTSVEIYRHLMGFDVPLDLTTRSPEKHS